MTVLFIMSSEVSIKSLRAQDLWLIALTCLALNLPAAYMVPLAKGSASSFELTTQIFEAVLQGSLVESPDKREHLKQDTATDIEYPSDFLASQMPQSSAGLLQIIATPHWITHHHPHSLPRPPPLV